MWKLLPGDLAQEILGQAATPETVAAFRKELGLDQPPITRYWNWLLNLLQGDFGRSLANKREISELLGTRLFNTFFLAGVAAIVAVPLSLLLGILAALYRNSIYDRVVNLFTLSSISFPEFFVAYILLMVFSVNLGWFPSLSNVDASTPMGERLYKVILPALDADSGCAGTHDAHDPSVHHQSSIKSVHRNGTLEGDVQIARNPATRFTPMPGHPLSTLLLSIWLI